MFWSRAHLAWLAVWFVGTFAYTVFFVAMLIDDRVFSRYGVLQSAGLMLMLYTLPVAGAYLAGLAVGWVVPRVSRTFMNVGRRTLGRLTA